MTENEKQEALKSLKEKQLELMQIMSEDDAHAIKCVKMGLTYEEQYPDEHSRYLMAREQYNRNEVQIAQIEETETEEPMPVE